MMTNMFDGGAPMTKLLDKNHLSGLIGLSVAALVLAQAATGGEPSSQAKNKLSPTLAADVARRVMEITDAVLEHHIDPPARQQMILDGIEGLYQAAGLPDPVALSMRVSSVTTRDQLAALLADLWPLSPAKPVETEKLVQMTLEGLLKSIPGDPELLSAKDRKVADQIKWNRYVGIHISLGMDAQEKRPTIGTIIEGGPAYKAGIKSGDIIEQVDDFDTKAKDIHEIVDRIRGEEGSLVAIKVRQPQSTQSRTYKVRRGTLPRSTVQGFRKSTSDGWDFRIDGPNPIGYIKINEFSTSSAHELRKLAAQLESEGYRALVLDLRGLGGDSVHPVVLLADSLLDGGTIGRVRTAHGERTYQADSDALFRGWPMAVLVNIQTSGTAEWLAAALHDNHRAVLVGTLTTSVLMEKAKRNRWNTLASHLEAVERSTIPIGDGTTSMVLATGRLERGDGRALSGEPVSNPDGNRQGPLRLAKPDLRTPRSALQSRKSLMADDEALRQAIEVLRTTLKKV